MTNVGFSMHESKNVQPFKLLFDVDVIIAMISHLYCNFSAKY